MRAKKEAAAGGEPAAEKEGRVLMVKRFCSKEEVLWRLRNALLGGRGQDGNLFSVILYMSTALGGRVGSGNFG